MYYALFHRLAKCCADSVVGRKAAETNRAEWRRVYRALDHVAARRGCTDPAIATFPENVRGIAQLFVESQNRRHDADHDPHGDWFKSEVLDRIATARQAIRDFDAADLRDKRAFAVHLLFGGWVVIRRDGVPAEYGRARPRRYLDSRDTHSAYRPGSQSRRDPE